MTIPDLLDGAFAIVKRRPRDVFVLAVAFVVPVEVLSALLLRDVLSGDLFATDDVGTFDGPFAGLDTTLTSFAIGAISLALLAGALAHMVAAWYAGEDLPPGTVIRHTLRRSPALLVGVVVVHVLELVGLIALIVGAYFAMALLHVVSPVIVAEGVGPFRAIARSVRLTSSRFGTSLIVPSLVGLIGALVGFGFQLLPELATIVIPDDWVWLARATGQTLAQLVVVPFTAGVAVLYHLDLRIRSEGFDIEMRARAVFDR
ncbi:MAG: hypothetical protein ACSLFO_00555 [Acidimicrobiales bacterium]